MIKINLLGDALAQAGAKKPAAEAAPQNVQVFVDEEGGGRAGFPLAGAIMVLLALAGAGTYIFMIFNEVGSLQVKKAALDEEYTKYDKYIKLKEDFEAKKALLAKKEEVIGGLKRQQALTVHFMEELASSLPDNVVFTKVSQKGMGFVIEGEGRNPEAINQFYTELQKRNRWFKNINLPEEKMTPQRTFSFKITFDLENAV